MSHGSTRTHCRVCSQCCQRGFARRVSSMPSARVGAGSTSSSSAWATNARCAVGHDTPWLVATSVTERAASPIAAPIWLRNRLVVRARARDLGDGLGERAALAVVLPAPPPGFVPPQHDSVFAVADVLGRGANPGFHRRGEHPTRWARRPRSCFQSPRAPHASHRPSARHARPVPLAAQTTMSYRQTLTFGSLRQPECFATFRLRKTRGLQLQRHAL